ncbi:YybH family protein [Altererythrobacter sp.]|uniref:YybH family protein n=1 Tax=Altererythrobacter sp. TaxID=1872480 RepID=UPI003D0EB858
MRAMTLGALAPALMLAACNQAAEAPAADPQAVLDAIAQVEQGQETAFNADDLAGATGVYASDATFFNAGGAPADGSEAINAEFDGMFKDANSGISITRDKSWVAGSGELAVTQSHYTFTFSGDDGNPMSVEGVNLTVWQKQDDGSWKIASDFNGGTGPATPAEAAPAAE